MAKVRVFLGIIIIMLLFLWLNPVVKILPPAQDPANHSSGSAFGSVAPTAAAPTPGAGNVSTPRARNISAPSNHAPAPRGSAAAPRNTAAAPRNVTIAAPQISRIPAPSIRNVPAPRIRAPAPIIVASGSGIRTDLTSRIETTNRPATQPSIVTTQPSDQTIIIFIFILQQGDN